MEKRLFKGQFSTTLEMDTTDVFFDITKELMSVYEFEMGEKYSPDFLINGQNRVLVVTINKKAAIVCKMVSCDIAINLLKEIC